MQARFLTLVIGISLLAPFPAAAAPKWDPIPDEFLEMDDCETEPGCRAVHLRAEVRWDNDYGNSRFTYHRITKILTQEGLGEASVKIEKWVGESEIIDLQGRTILPNGTEVDLDPYSAIEETGVKGRGFRQKVISFQMPGVEIGSIIEYRYTIVHKAHIGYHTWWVQEHLPVVEASLALRSPKFAIISVPISLKGIRSGTTAEDKQWSVLSFHYVPSFREEPYMPPENEARGHVVFRPATLSWKLGDLRYGFDEYLKKYYKRSGKAKKLAKEALGEASTAEEKIERAYRYVQDNFVNTSYRQSTEVDSEETRNLYVDDTVLAGQGNKWDLTRLFVFILRQGGLKADVALIATRDSGFFRKESRHRSDLEEELAAVKVLGEWRFFDPGTPYCPLGMVSWEKEGLMPNALMPGGSMVQVPPSRAADNLTSRKTHIQLAEDGGMTASVGLVYEGLAATRVRNSVDHKTPEERRHALEENLKELFEGAEVEELEYENLDAWNEPLRMTYRVRSDGFATAAGGRLFAPILLYPDQNPFTTEERRHLVYFRQTFQETSETTLEIPDGYEIEALPRGRNVDLSALRYRMQIQNDSPGVLVATRELVVDTHLIELHDYEVVREMYEAMERAESQQLVLRRAEADAVSGQEEGR